MKTVGDLTTMDLTMDQKETKRSFQVNSLQASERISSELPCGNQHFLEGQTNLKTCQDPDRSQAFRHRQKLLAGISGGWADLNSEMESL